MKEVKSFTTFDFTIILGFISRVIIDIERYFATLIKVKLKKKKQKSKNKKTYPYKFRKKKLHNVEKPTKENNFEI